MSDEQLSPTDIAWLAGMIGGEGYVGLYSQRREGHEQYKPTVQITGTHRPALDALRGTLDRLGVGCHVYWRRPGRRGSYAKRDSWIIQVNGIKRVKPLLDALQPYLVVKRWQAHLLRAWITRRQSQPVHSSLGTWELDVVRLMREANQGRLSDYSLEIAARQIGAMAGEGRVCPMCGATFEPRRSDQQFCSRRCRNRAATRRYRERLKRDSHSHQGD